MTEWARRWKVPSSDKGDGDGNWTVAQDIEGNWGCSCPVWKFHRKECKHINLIRTQETERPKDGTVRYEGEQNPKLSEGSFIEL